VPDLGVVPGGLRRRSVVGLDEHIREAHLIHRAAHDAVDVVVHEADGG